MMYTNADERDARKRRYEKVLRKIQYNPGGPDQPQSAGIRREHIPVNASVHADYDSDGIKSALKAAVENGDVFRFEDTDGEQRYALATIDGLRAVIGEQNASDGPDRDLIPRGARRLEEVHG